MLVIRPTRAADRDDLKAIAADAGMGLTTLPPEDAVLGAKLERSEASFAQRLPPEHAKYLFALEDTESARLVGVCGIEARVGLEDVWYSYRLSTCVTSAPELGVHVKNAALYLTNDLTERSEICSLLLHKDWRGNGTGPFLSRCRFLFLAEFPQFFADKIFAEMRGVCDDLGRSPFWEGLGAHFFNMEFHQADVLTSRGDKAFIAELMPKHPIYLALLNAQAQSVVGEVHAHTRPALHMLQSEGFNFDGLVDIFDGGPVLEAFRHNIRAVRDSAPRSAHVSERVRRRVVPPDEQVMVANRCFEDYRVITVAANRVSGEAIYLAPEEAEALQVMEGDALCFAALKQSTANPRR